MGRPEQPIDRDGSPVREFTHQLRELRGQAGLTYQQLAQQTHYSTSTLQEAMSGRRLPTVGVLSSVVTACGGDIAAWLAYRAEIQRFVDYGVAAGAPGDFRPPWLRATADEAAGAELAAPSRSSSRRHRVVLVGALAAVVLAIVVILVILTMHRHPVAAGFPSPERHPPVPTGRTGSRTYIEQEFNPNGAPSFLHLAASGAGIPVAYGEFVQVSCKVHDTTVPSTQPDGYWYRIASMPWFDHYYAVANTFGNGDRLGGPDTHNTDGNVPNW